MLNLLKKMCLEKKYVSIYLASSNDSKFIYGRIICVNEEHAAIYMLALDGGYDGILVRKTEDIIRIEIGGFYAKKMEKLYADHDLKPELYLLDENNIAESLLLKAQKESKIICLEILDSGYEDVVGYVENIYNGLCTINRIDEYGAEDGNVFVEIKNITQISFESKAENIIQKLNT